MRNRSPDPSQSTGAAPSSLRLNTTSDPANLAPVRKAVEALARQAGFDEASIGEIALCVNEAMANITRHAYGGAVDRPILVQADVLDDVLTLSLRDWGNGVDPTRLRPRPRDPLRPGGLGLICMHELMDRIVFAPQSDGMLLTLTRSRSRQACTPETCRCDVEKS